MRRCNLCKSSNQCKHRDQRNQRNPCKYRNQRGTSMPEALMAVLLFSVVALALMRYQQRLEQTQRTWLDHQRALHLCHQALECHRLGWRETSLDLPAGWRLRISQHPRGPNCMNIVAEVCTPSRRGIKLEEWFCTGLSDAAAFAYPG